MVAGTLFLVVAAAAKVGSAAAPAQSPKLLPSVHSAERLQLPRLRGPLTLEVDTLGASLALVAPRDVAALVSRVKTVGINICPRWEAREDRLVLRCRTRRLQATLAEEGGQTYLDIQELRGLPRVGADDLLPVFYDPVLVGHGGPCPGTSPAGRGECAFKAGQLAEAELQWKLALALTSERPLASLRLGDLAAARGDLVSAIVAWTKAGGVGPFGRLAVARLCELTGNCLDRPIDRIFDGGELAQPMRTELVLRGARIDMYLGRTADGLRRLADLIARRAGGGCVAVGERMCRRLLLAALNDSNAETARAAVEVYLTLPNRLQGTYAIELGRAAAARAWQLGAPIFAANLSVSVAALVPEEELPDHLLHTAELYLAGKDPVRAQLIVEYGETRFEGKRLGGPRWVLVKKMLSRGDSGGRPVPDLGRLLVTTEAIRDLASAMSALARSRAGSPGM